MDAPVAMPSSTRKTVRPAIEAGGRSPAVEACTPGQFMLLLARNFLDQTPAEPGLVDDSFVEDLNAAVGDSPKCQLALTGHAQLTHQEQVQVGPKGLCGFKGDRHAPPQQSQHERLD